MIIIVPLKTGVSGHKNTHALAQTDNHLHSIAHTHSPMCLRTHPTHHTQHSADAHSMNELGVCARVAFFVHTLATHNGFVAHLFSCASVAARHTDREAIRSHRDAIESSPAAAAATAWKNTQHSNVYVQNAQREWMRRNGRHTRGRGRITRIGIIKMHESSPKRSLIIAFRIRVVCVNCVWWGRRRGGKRFVVQVDPTRQEFGMTVRCGAVFTAIPRDAVTAGD